nr:NAD(P)-dependent alcohol dehydrogenase [uncultured Cohaesibacter sp.]
MCENCKKGTSPHIPDLSRRTILSGGAALLGAVAAGTSLGAQKAVAQPQSGLAVGSPIKAHGYGLTKAGEPLKPVDFSHRPMRADDIVIDVMYAGICHSDIHTGRGDWGPVAGLIVPGHEIVGRVVATGPQVSKFKVGDIAGVGTMVDSCGTCANCVRGLEQYCLNGTTWTYGPDRRNGGQVYGGYADRLVVREHFGYHIPEGMDLRSAAPLLCAGITTFSPLNHWDIEPGMKTAVVGLGGLGHMALKFLVERGADVTVFTTTPAKTADATRMGARQAVVWPDEKAFAKLSGHFDFIIVAVPHSYKVDLFVPLLKVDGNLVNVGVLGQIEGINGFPLVLGRRSIAGSNVGGVPETQQLLNYCAAKNIRPEVEVIAIDQVNAAWDRVIAKDVRYRFVIDMSTLKS